MLGCLVIGMLSNGTFSDGTFACESSYHMQTDGKMVCYLFNDIFYIRFLWGNTSQFLPVREGERG